MLFLQKNLIFFNNKLIKILQFFEMNKNYFQIKFQFFIQYKA